MSKATLSRATTAVASLLLVACVFGFGRWVVARVAANGIVCAAFLFLILGATITGMGSRPRLRATRFLRYAMLALLVLLVPALLWASFGTSFYGVVTPLSTGGVALSFPNGLAVDKLGNVYIADSNHSQIVEVTTAGVASVLAFPGLSPALSHPQAVAVDAAGNVYVADSNNARVVELSGGVASVVPTGGLLAYPDGLALDAAGDLFIADGDASRIVEVPAVGVAAVLTITGLGTPLDSPEGLAVDASGKLYIADGNNNRIVIVAPGGAGSVLSIIGGLTLNFPLGVAVDGLGNVYIADTFNNRIVDVAPDGTPTVLLIGSDTLLQPRAVAVDPSGTVYIGDSGDSRILLAYPNAVGFRHLPVGATSGTTLSFTFSVANGTTLSSVQALTLGAASLDFTVVAAGTTCVAGTTGAQSCNVNVQFLPTAGGLRRGAVVLFDNSTPPVPLLSVPIYGTADAPLATLSPGAASVVSSGNVPTPFPFQLALDGAGNLFIADYGTDRIVVVTAGGVASVLTISGLGTSLDAPAALAFDAAGNLYIADHGVGRVVEVSALVVGASSTGNGSVLGTGSYTFAPFYLTGVAIDAAGTVYLAVQGGNRVVVVTAAGAASLLVPAGVTPVLSDPGGVAVDGFGNVYISDTGNNRIVEVTSAGVASVVALQGLSSPVLSAPYNVSVGPSGNVFIPDSLNNRIVQVNVAAASLSFPNTDVGSASSAQTATVTNIGDVPLIFAAAPTYTLNFSENTGDTNLCALNTSLVAGTVCDVSVEFTPQSAGSLSANIVATNNNLNLAGSTQTVAVSGLGVAVADSTAVTVSTNPTGVVLGQSITVTAIVTDTTAGHTATIPTGGVTFMDTVGSTTISLNGGTAVALNGAGDAMLGGVTLVGAGTHTITANYAGVAGTFSASSNTTTIPVSALAATTTTLSAAPNPSVAGQSVVFTATVAPAPTGTPTGTVSFYNGETLLGTGTVNSSGVATFTSSSLPAGALSITGVYSGNAGFATSTSSIFTETVLAATTTTLSAAPNPAVAGQSVVFTATVAPAPTGTPTGTVSLYNGETLLGMGTVNSSGVATFTTSSLPVGALSITGIYSGNPGFATSTSSIFTETVTPATTATTTTLTASPNPGAYGQPATLTATVSPAPTGSPAGIISFYSGATLLGTATLNPSGVATFTTSSLVVGADSITAAYPGNAGFAASTSSAVSETVTTSYTVTAPSTPVPVTEGGSVAVNITVPPLGGPFNSVVTLSASGLPPGATATFNPATVTPGSAGATTAMTIQLPRLIAGIALPGNAPPGTAPASRRRLPLAPFTFTLAFAVCGVLGRGRRPKAIALCLATLALVGATVILTGCNGGLAAGLSTPPGNYVIAVTGTSGTQSVSTNFTLALQR